MNASIWSISRKILALAVIPALCVAALVAFFAFETQSRLEELRGAKARTALDAALHILRSYDAKVVNGEMSLEDAQAAALEAIGAIRFDHGEGYVAITNDQYYNVIHPTIPDFNGAYVKDFKSSDGIYIVQKGTELGKSGKISELEYVFDNPASGTSEKKRSAIGRFDAWGWTLYAGIYNARFERIMGQLLADILKVASVFIALMLALAIATARSIVGPITSLKTRIQELANGKLDAPIPHACDNSEIGEVARATEVFRETAKELTRVQSELEQALNTSEVSLNLAMEGGSLGAWDWDIKADHIKYSDANRKMLGLTRDQWPNDINGYFDLIHPDDKDLVKAAVQHHLDGDGPYQAVYRMRHADGSWLWWRSNGRIIRFENEKPAHMIGTNADITDLYQARELAERQAAELAEQNDKLRQMHDREAWSAQHDELTKLPNRRCVETNWKALSQKALRRGRALAALHIDMDHFKRVNDRLGHSAGDALLVQLASRLRGVLSEDDMVARIGGDEFLAIVQTDHAGQRAEQLGQLLIDEARKPFKLDGHEFRLGASVGVATSDPAITDLKQVVADADSAMYAAKSSGRFRVKIFDEADAEQKRKRQRLADDLFAAIDNAEFEPFYQPQVRSSDFSIVGVEALARWRHPELGVLPPFQFIPLAEEIGVIDKIDDAILRSSAEAICNLEEEIGEALRLGVNFSLRRLSDLTLTPKMQDVRAPKGGLSVEIVESIFLDDADQAVLWNIDNLRESGFTIELDDFGSGHTSVISLVKLNPHRIKIDRQLIQAAFNDQAKFSIIRAIMEMAQELSIEVLAEGVEEQAQALELKRIGIPEMQGYHFGRPTEFSAFREMLLSQGGVARAS